MVFCLIALYIPQCVFAREIDIISKDIDLIYEEAYNKALIQIPQTINSEDDAYAYILAHMDFISRVSDGTILLNEEGLGLNEQEKGWVLNFIEKLNKLIQLEAVTVDENMKLHFLVNPSDERILMRRPTASIMPEARRHAKELKEVFDNAVLTTKHYTAGMYFAERVKTGGIWDYKSYMGTNTVYYMEDLNTNMTGETIGNFHYGYVGRAVFEAATLKSAAGMYQIVSGTSSLGYWKTFFDDPADQHDIEWGIQKYNSEH